MKFGKGTDATDTLCAASIPIGANVPGLSKLLLPEPFDSFSNFWAVAATIAQLIFEGGTLLHRQRAAQASYEGAVATYRSTVVGAVQNTADTLHALSTDGDGQARILLLQAEVARCQGVAVLFQALGGGWWNDAATTARAR